MALSMPFHLIGIVFIVTMTSFIIYDIYTISYFEYQGYDLGSGNIPLYFFPTTSNQYDLAAVYDPTISLSNTDNPNRIREYYSLYPYHPFKSDILKYLTVNESLLPYHLRGGKLYSDHGLQNISSHDFLMRSRFYKSPPPKACLSTAENVPKNKDKFYGTDGNSPHLGGWIDFDRHGVSNMTWDFMIGILGVKSLLDIGCGRGYSTNYFHKKGVRVMCIEGSKSAIEATHLPSKDLIVEHDYSQGPYWPDDTFDACWSVEFLEHVSRRYFQNYINSFRKCALVFITASRTGGYHHVEVHEDYWWKGRFLASGFLDHPELTQVIRKVPLDEKDYLRQVFNKSSIFDEEIGPIGMHIMSQMQVFINPMVAFLPEHVHIFAGDGCMHPNKPTFDQLNNIDGGVPCQGVDTLPKRYDAFIRCIKDDKMRNKLQKSVEDMYWSCFRR